MYIYQSTDLLQVKLCVSSNLALSVAVSTVTNDSCRGGKG